MRARGSTQVPQDGLMVRIVQVVRQIAVSINRHSATGRTEGPVGHNREPMAKGCDRDGARNEAQAMVQTLAVLREMRANFSESAFPANNIFL